MYQYLLTIPVQLQPDVKLDPNHTCSLIDRKMQDYTKEVLQFQADSNQYPDLLAKFILDTQLKAAVAAITYEHANFNYDQYAINFKILTHIQLDQNLTERLIEFMAGQMSDGLLENGLTLVEYTDRINRNEEAYDNEANLDVIMWPEWVNNDLYELAVLKEWFYAKTTRLLNWRIHSLSASTQHRHDFV